MIGNNGDLFASPQQQYQHTMTDNMVDSLYSYIQSINETKDLELQHKQREYEVSMLIRDHDLAAIEAENRALQQALETNQTEKQILAMQVAQLESSSAQMSTSKDTLTNDLEKKNHKLAQEISVLKQKQETNSKISAEKRALDKELGQIKVTLETTKRTLANHEKDKQELQQSEKKLKQELQELKSQLKQSNNGQEKANRELERLKQKHESEKKVWESKIDTLKNRIKSAESRPPSPIKQRQSSASFSPVVKKPASLSSKDSTKKSAFSTTPFLQKTKSSLVLSPSPAKKGTNTNINRSPLIKELKPDQVTVTTKDNKQRSLFEDSEDENVSPQTQSQQLDLNTKKKRKLKAQKSAFDDDDDDTSWFKRVKPLNSSHALGGKISPLKSRNEQFRNAFKV